MAQLLRVIEIKTGDGKILYTKQVDGPFIAKLAKQIEFRHRGIKAMEMKDMWSSDFDRLSYDKIAVLEIGS